MDFSQGAGRNHIRRTWAQTAKPDPLPKLSLPIGWWLAYATVGWAVWAAWPADKQLPTELWLAVLSFEGVLAALLASAGSAITYQAVVPAVVAFWSALDPVIGQRMTEAIQRHRDDPAQAPSPSPFKNAFVVSLNVANGAPWRRSAGRRWRPALPGAAGTEPNDPSQAGRA